MKGRHVKRDIEVKIGFRHQGTDNVLHASSNILSLRANGTHYQLKDFTPRKICSIFESKPAKMDRVAIGLSFGNSYSSIANTTAVFHPPQVNVNSDADIAKQEGKAEVIANEEGGSWSSFGSLILRILTAINHRSPNSIDSVIRRWGGSAWHPGKSPARSQPEEHGRVLQRLSRSKVCLVAERDATHIEIEADNLKPSFKSIDPSPCHQSAHPHEHDSKVVFSIRDGEEETETKVSVSEITTRHLRRLKTSASDFLGKEVNAAVVAVPTNFADAQKEALRGAANEAGLEVLQFISEPVAAVLAYDARHGTETSDKILVVADLGGIRSDVTVIASRGGIYTTLATVHDYNVGGNELDQVLIDFFATEFKKKNPDASDPRKNERSLAKMKLECEAVKKALSLSSTATFSVESLSSSMDYTHTVNRTRYELKASKVFAAITRLVQHAVNKAQLDPLDIHEVILCGGTSHTPRIASSIAAAFPESTVIQAPSTKSDAIDPSELAARGAAIQASLIEDFEQEDISESCHPVVTVTPHLQHAIGVVCSSSDNKEGDFKPLIEADTPVPVRRTLVFAGSKTGGDVLIKVCEGSHHIKVETKVRPQKKKADSDSDSDSDEDSDEEEETREKVWKVGRPIAEAAVRDTKKGGKIEVQINVAPDLGVTVIAREVGGKGGVRGVVDKPAAEANGST